MKRWSIAAAAAGFLAVCVAVPVQAAEFCLADPPLNIQTSPGESFTVYVTEGVLGSEHQAALSLATITYTTSPLATGAPDRARAETSPDRGTRHPEKTAPPINEKSVLVTVYDSIPSDSSGTTFATMMIVSSQPFGHGVVYGSVNGTSGSTMSVSFGINPQKDPG